jgi:hypothetical protein
METYDIKSVLFHIGEKGKTSHKAINYNSFLETFNKPVIQQRLKDGLLMGLLTHFERDKARSAHIPHHDMVMRDPDLCNILRKVTVKDGVVYGYLDLTDTEAGKRVKALWKQQVKLGVSISTELVERDEFFIKDFYGVDITTRPEFDTPIVEGNFSERTGRADSCFEGFQLGCITADPTETVLGDFSEVKPEEKSESKFKDFSESKKEAPQKDFSVREYLRERQKKPAMVLKARIKDIILYLRMSRAALVRENKTFLRRYISEYINEWILVSINQPNSDFNLSLGLRLSEYCKDRAPMRDLQIALRRAKAQIEGNGAISKDVQSKLNLEFQHVLNEIYDYINSKVDNEDKRI